MLRWLETLVYKLTGVREDEEQRWTHYGGSLVAFSLFAFLFTYFIQRAQAFLPLNPQHFGAGNVSPDLAFNTAVSFVTNTNWQAYAGESTLSYFAQMAALAVQNFISAAAGIAIAVALTRGFARQFVLVTKLTAVLNARSGLTFPAPKCCGFSGRKACMR